jgi:hypothetical protein
MTFADGTVYTGPWKDDKQHGLGVEAFPNGDNRTGYWVEGNKVGVFSFCSGEKTVKEIFPNVKHDQPDDIF